MVMERQKNKQETREMEKIHENELFALTFENNFLTKEIEQLESSNAAKNMQIRDLRDQLSKR